MDNRIAELQLRIQKCERCPLHQSRKMAVPGEGKDNAEIMFVGQGPGEHEDETGRPFVGAAGVLLEKLLQRVDIQRTELWLTNVTRCLPAEERLPNVLEIKSCAPYLLEEIEIIKPKVVCPLGNMALSLLLRKPSQIRKLRGRPIPSRSHFLFPMLHPAAALRRPDFLPDVQEDFRNLKRFLDTNPVLRPLPGQESLF